MSPDYCPPTAGGSISAHPTGPFESSDASQRANFSAAKSTGPPFSDRLPDTNNGNNALSSTVENIYPMKRAIVDESGHLLERCNQSA